METIPTNGPNPFELLKALTELQRQAIVRPSNPPPGIAGFLFDIPEEEEINLRAEITDHFLESNFAIADHIAIKPEEYTVRGLVAEIAAYAPAAPATAAVENPLPANPNVLPELTPGAEEREAQLELDREELIASFSGENTLYNFFKARSAAPPDQTKQRRTFLYFYQLFQARQLFTVETPWGVLNNVAILTMRAAQDDETRFRSSFAITFKVIRTAGAVTVAAGQLAGRALQQAADTTQNGTAGKAPVQPEERQSLLYRFLNGP